MIYEFEHLHEYLRAELVKRMSKNASYSLRAYARDLGVPAPHLSEFLNRKRRFGKVRAVNAARALKLEDREAEYFYTLAELEEVSETSAEALVRTRLNTLRPKERQRFSLSSDTFDVLSDWKHFAFLERIGIRDLQANSESLASDFDCSVVEAQSVLDRLSRLGLARLNEQGFWEKVSADLHFEDFEINHALRKFHRETLQLALKALELQSPEERDSASLTLAFSRQKLEKVRELFSHWIEALNRESENENPNADVYHLNLQFFRLNNLNSKGRNI